MANLFLSYRRDDSADVAGRISDRLVQHFGKDHVFTDVDSIPLGLNFATHIDNQVAQCDIFLAAIGPDWLTHLKSRADDPKDYVRIEIESSLKRSIPVIPLLVRGGSVPAEKELPACLSELAYRQGIPIRSGQGFHSDVNELIKALEPKSQKRKGRVVAALGVLIVLGFAGVTARYFGVFDKPDSSSAIVKSELRASKEIAANNTVDSNTSVQNKATSEHKKALATLSRGCEGGNAQACSGLGAMYVDGSGVEQDDVKAVSLFRRSCEGGNARGCNGLGVMYQDGSGVGQDESKAVSLFRWACESKYAMGCNNLGVMYLYGLGVAQDEARGVTLFRRACEGGGAKGCFNLSDMYKHGRVVAQDDARAASLIKKACKLGQTEACSVSE